MNKFSSKEGEIFYSIEGKGPRHFLLVHNAGGNHEMMCRSTAYFSKSGKTITPDLLGHGSSSSPKIDYTLNVFAESLIQLCQYEKLDQIVFIGLNYGANIGIEMAQIFPGLISHLVLIEPPIFMEQWIAKMVEQHIKELEHHREEYADEIVDSVLIKAPTLERQIALKAMKTTSSYVKASTYKHLLMWDKQHVFNCSIPTLMIQTSQPFCSEEKARTCFSNLQIGRVVGSGPWANLEVPIQVHSMIDRFFELNF